MRSGTPPALNYGEAQAAESRRDFIHKLRISLKELRETLVALKIIKRAELCNSNEKLLRNCYANCYAIQMKIFFIN